MLPLESNGPIVSSTMSDDDGGATAFMAPSVASNFSLRGLPPEGVLIISNRCSVHLLSFIGVEVVTCLSLFGSVFS